MSACFQFSRTASARDEIRELFRDLAKAESGKILEKPQAIYLKNDEPKFYLIYTDRMKLYGNHIRLYLVDEQTEQYKYIANRLSESFSDFSRCMPEMKSSISDFDFTDNVHEE